MAVFDDFNREFLGPNYAAPGRINELAPEIIDQSPELIGIQPAVHPTFGSSALWTADGEFSTEQFAEIENLNDIATNVGYTTYYNDFASLGVLLNTPLPNADNQGYVLARLTSSTYLTTPTYGPVYYDIQVIGRDGSTQVAYTYAYVDLADVGFTGGNRIPAGAKIRCERFGSKYYLYIYSPDTDQWYTVIDGWENTEYSHGYAGIRISYTQAPNDCQVSNFRAGQVGDTFRAMGDIPANDYWNNVAGPGRGMRGDNTPLSDNPNFGVGITPFQKVATIKNVTRVPRKNIPRRRR